MIPPAVQALLIRVAIGRRSNHDHASGRPAVSPAAGHVTGFERSGNRRRGRPSPPRAAPRARRGHRERSAATHRRRVDAARRPLLIPFDGEQTFSEDAVARRCSWTLACPSADLRPATRPRRARPLRPDPPRSRRRPTRHPCQAVPGVAARAEPAQPGHAERQQQPAVGAAASPNRAATDWKQASSSAGWMP